MVGTPKNRVALGTGLLEHRLGIEPFEEQHRAAREEPAVQTDAEAVHMAEGQGQDQAVVGVPTPGQSDCLRPGQQVGMREHGPLGCAGRPRRVHDEPGIRSLDAVERGGGPCARDTSGAVTVRLGSMVTAHSREVFGPAQCQCGLGVGDHRFKLAPGSGRVDRDHHHPGPQGRAMGDHQRRRCRSRRHAIAGSGPGSAETAGHDRGLLEEGAPGEPCAVGPADDPVIGGGSPASRPRRRKTAGGRQVGAIGGQCWRQVARPVERLRAVTSLGRRLV